MPTKRTKEKKETIFNRNFFLTVVLAIALGVGLYFVVANFYPEALQGLPGLGGPSNELNLKCSKASDDQIKCSWENCELKTNGEKTELVFAKVPNYVKSMNVPTDVGSILFSPAAPVQGLYTIYISCDNGKVATRVAM